ncbi:MAG: hypothetical protein QXT48_00670 [Thermoplasmatales archaeon]
MVAEKIVRFQGKNRDINEVGSAFAKMLEEEGYNVQTKQIPSSFIIQAKKAGILRDIITAERAFTIMISGEPNDFTLRIGIGKLFQNLAVMAAEAILLSELFLAVDVPETLWSIHVEKELINKFSQLVS